MLDVAPGAKNLQVALQVAKAASEVPIRSKGITNLLATHCLTKSADRSVCAYAFQIRVNLFLSVLEQNECKSSLNTPAGEHSNWDGKIWVIDQDIHKQSTYCCCVCVCVCGALIVML